MLYLRTISGVLRRAVIWQGDNVPFKLERVVQSSGAKSTLQTDGVEVQSKSSILKKARTIKHPSKGLWLKNNNGLHLTSPRFKRTVPLSEPYMPEQE